MAYIYRSLLLLLICIFTSSLATLKADNKSEQNNKKNNEIQIVGGKTAKLAQIPWQVSIFSTYGGQSDLSHFCGGSILDSTWIITAAHCFYNELTVNDEIFIETGSISLNTGVGQLRKVSQIILHPNFNSENNDNDVCLLRLEIPLKLDSTTQIIPIAEPKDLEFFSASKNALISGWGNTKATVNGQGPVSYPDNLQYAEVPIVDNSTAEQWYYDFGYDAGSVKDNMIAAGFEKGGVDACQGDSGGPLAVKNSNSNWILAGITSWGEGCAEAQLPGIYTRVSSFSDWIKTNSEMNLAKSNFANDAKIASVSYSKDSVAVCNNGKYPIDIVLLNAGTNIITKANIQLQVANSSPINLDVVPPSALQIGASFHYLAKIDFPNSLGNQIIKTTILSVNNVNDENSSNNVQSTNVFLEKGQQLTLKSYTDADPSTTAWYLVETESQKVALSSEYYTNPNSSFTQTACLKETCYSLYAYSESALNIEKAVEIFDKDNKLILTVKGSEFVYPNKFDFCIESTSNDVENLDANTQISLSPIPANDYINITNISSNLDRISIHDIFGNKVEMGNTSFDTSKNAFANMGNLSIDVSNLSNGVYFILLEKDGQVNSKKFTIQR